MKKESEAAIQQSIYVWANNTYCTANKTPSCIIHSVPNGIGLNIPYKTESNPKGIIPNIYRGAITKAISIAMELLKLVGLVPGISDLMMHGVIGRCIWIEVKTSTGEQSPDQIKMQKKVEALGGVYLLVRSLPDAQQQISKYIGWLIDVNVTL